LAKRLTNKQIEEIIINFSQGKSIEELSKEFQCTKLTISRNLKKKLGEKNFKDVLSKTKSKVGSSFSEESYSKDITVAPINKNISEKNISEPHKYNQNSDNNDINQTQFFEIAPLDCEIDSTKQKDLSSRSIEEISFPDLVYMIVDKKIELEIKLLKEYSDWQFLSQEELNRKTIKIYYDSKSAKRECNKEQRVIKVPNTNVFKLVAPLLISRGISRIITEDKLIAL